MTVADPPLISVVMPVFNGAKYLSDSIQSILGQSFSNFELIIVDDGSTDDSFDVALKWKDDRIRIFPSQQRRGVAAALNTGIRVARGEFIARMDCDDIAHSTRLAEQLKYLSAHADVGALGTWAQILQIDGTLGHFLKQQADSARISALIWRQCPLLHPTVMFRRELFDAFAYDEEAIAEDYDLWYRMVRAGVKLANIRRVLLKYRVHPRQVTFEKYQIRNDAFRVFCKYNPSILISYEEYCALTMSALTLTFSARYILWSAHSKYLSVSACWVFIDQMKYLFLLILSRFRLLSLSPWRHIDDPSCNRLGTDN